MKLVGRISVNFDAENFIEAGIHQKELERLAELFKAQYPQAELEISQRRSRKPMGLDRAPAPKLPLRRAAGR